MLPKEKIKPPRNVGVGLPGPGTQQRQMTGAPVSREWEASAQVCARPSRGQGGRDRRASKLPHSPGEAGARGRGRGEDAGLRAQRESATPRPRASTEDVGRRDSLPAGTDPGSVSARWPEPR